MSKRVLIILAVGIVAIIAAFILLHFEKKVTIEDEDEEEEEIFVAPVPRKKKEPEPVPESPIAEPIKNLRPDNVLEAVFINPS